MAALDARDVPVDPRSRERLSASGLDYRIADMSDPVQRRGFARADARGFLDKEPDDDTIGLMGEMMSERRNIGVYAPGAADVLPVATVDSWVTPMTVPGAAGAHVDMWAISAVTVAATHRRRGIARNLLEGELRAAAAAGVPIAGLTATEATIYGRYGFGAAIPVSRLTVDARRAGGIALPAADGATTVEYLEPDALMAALDEVHERTRLGRAGDIPGWPLRWRRMAGLAAGDDRARAVRGVRAFDAGGVTRGVLAFTLDELPDEFGADLAIRHLDAETPEALRALWAFAVNHDLIRTVRADLRPVDDPLPWLVANQRAVQNTVHDHGWLRILDVPAALSARRYRAPLDLVLRVSDPLGLADGSWRLRIDADGKAAVDADTAAPDVELGVDALSSLYLGGVGAPTLHAAGRISASARTAAAVQDAFGTAVAPALSIWY